jgi:hypothetical protein
MTSKNIFGNFNRFYLMLAPDTSFFPTARQVRHLAFALLDKSRVNVVIGGSSVFYGVGQPEGMTIADNLRRELGGDYRVINLAMRGGDVSGMAEETTEMLLREGYKVIYLTDIGVATGPQPIGSLPYQYFYWDAKARGYLMDWPLRDAALGEGAWLSNPALGGWLNSFLNFNDLWNTIGYEKFFTVFTSLLPNSFWVPRKKFSDNEIDPPVESRYRNSVDVEMRIVHGISQPLVEPQWDGFRQAFDVAIPGPVRRFMVVAVCENSPFYLDQATQSERDNRRVLRQTTVQIIEKLGASGVVNACEGFDKDDYVDRVHLSVQGAGKITSPLAAAVRALAAKDGM